jgi:hypothetical protein
LRNQLATAGWKSASAPTVESPMAGVATDALADAAPKAAVVEAEVMLA